MMKSPKIFTCFNFSRVLCRTKLARRPRTCSVGANHQQHRTFHTITTDLIPGAVNIQKCKYGYFQPTFSKLSAFTRQLSDEPRSTVEPEHSELCKDTEDSSVFSLKPADVMEVSDKDTRKLMEDLIIYEDFLSKEEEESLLAEIQPYMRKLRYEYDHWDDAIHGYRETEKKHWNEANQAIIQRVRDLAFPPDVPEAQLAFVHILDLEAKGYIKPHIDSVRFCGSIIAGMSLLSDSVMRLERENDPNSWANVLLRRRSLYIMRDVARYQFTHAVLSDQASYFRNQHVPRSRRISVICRNEAADLNGFPDTDDANKRRY